MQNNRHRYLFLPAGEMGLAKDAETVTEPRAAFDDIQCRPVLSAYQVLKIFLLGPTLLPVRVVSYFGLLGLHAMCCHVALWLRRIAPASPWAQRVANALAFGSAKWSSKLLLAVCGVRMHIIGWNNYLTAQRRCANQKAGGVLVVSNHSSHLDPLVLMACFAPSFVAVGVNRLDGARPSVVANCIAATDGVLVDQLQPSGAIARIAARLRRGPGTRAVVLFPEGTTSNGSCLLRFSTGAFVHGPEVAQVVPLVIRYPYTYCNGATALDTGLRKLPHLFWLAVQCVTHVVVEVLPPCVSDPSDSASVAERVRAAMADRASVPLASLTYRDKYAYLASAQ